jgi:hypothetical protein
MKALGLGTSQMGAKHIRGCLLCRCQPLYLMGAWRGNMDSLVRKDTAEPCVQTCEALRVKHLFSPSSHSSILTSSLISPLVNGSPFPPVQVTSSL